MEKHEEDRKANSRTIRRGVLAMVSGPLPYFTFSDNMVHNSLSARVIARRRNRPANSPSAMEAQAEIVKREEYDPTKSEFTLFFFSASTCRNSLRFGKILARFVFEANEASIKIVVDRENGTVGNLRPCEVVCVPNEASLHEVEIICEGTGFWVLPFEHHNRLGIIR